MRTICRILVLVAVWQALATPPAQGRKRRHVRYAPRSHSAPSRVSRPVRTPSYTVRFREELGVTAPILLSGRAASRAVVFWCEGSSRPAPGSALYLWIRHSQDLDDARSFLSVSVNNGILRSVRLDESNLEWSQVSISLPPGMLKLDNELLFTVEQAPRENGPGTAVWTEVGFRSYLTIQRAPEPPPLELSAWPLPLADRYSYGAKALDVVAPANASPETLEATALLVANLANAVAPSPLSVRVVHHLSDAVNPVLMAGLPGEQPSLRVLPEDSGLALFDGNLGPAVGLRSGQALAESQGIAGLVRDEVPVLFVTANSPAGVRNAARGLVAPGAKPAGRLVLVGKGPAPETVPRDWKGFIPRSARFRLADLGFGELKLTAADGYSVVASLAATPDARFLQDAAQATLAFRWTSPAAVDSRVEVRLNDQMLGEFPVRQMARSGTTLTLPLPTRLLRTTNALRLSVRGLPEAAEREVGEVLGNTSFYLPREYDTELPDLALLGFHLFPFSVLGDLSDTILLVPERVDDGMLGVIAELASALGRMAPAGHVGFRLRWPSRLMEREAGECHVIHLYALGVGSPPQQIFRGWQQGPPAVTGRGMACVQEAISPWNPKKLVLSLGAGSLWELEHLVRRLFFEGEVNRLRGGAVLFRGSQVTYYAREKRRFRQFSYLTRLETWLRTNWLALPIILTAASGMLFVILRLSLRHRRARRQTP